MLRIRALVDKNTGEEVLFIAKKVYVEKDRCRVVFLSLDNERYYLDNLTFDKANDLIRLCFNNRGYNLVEYGEIKLDQ